MATLEGMDTGSVSGAFFKIRPMTNVVGLSYRDGMTFQDMLYEIRDYVNKTLRDSVTEEHRLIIEQLNDYLEEYYADITLTKDDWGVIFDAYMEDVDASLQALNDTAVTNLVNNATSKLSVALSTLFADKATQTTVETGRLARATLNEEYTTESERLALLNNINTVQGDVDAVDTYARGGEVYRDIPHATIEFKHSGTYAYEVIRVHMSGRAMPGVVKKAFAHDYIPNTSDRGDNVVLFNPDTEPIQSIHLRKGVGITINSDSTDGASGRIRGLQIMDGVLYRDFETYQRGMHALGFKADGTVKGYKWQDGWTGETVLADGVVDTFGFGPLVVQNGIVQNIEAQPEWTSLVPATEVSGRQMMGVAQNKDILIVTVVGSSSRDVGIGGNAMCQLARREGMWDGIMLDGGGSAQTVYGGYNVHASSDSGFVRNIAGVFQVNCRVNQVPDSSNSQGLEMLELDTSLVDLTDTMYLPRGIVRGGTVSLYGNVVRTGGASWVAGAWAPVGRVPDKMRPPVRVPEGMFFETPVASVQIRSHGVISIRPVVNVTSVSLDGITYNGF